MGWADLLPTLHHPFSDLAAAEPRRSRPSLGRRPALGAGRGNPRHCRARVASAGLLRRAGQGRLVALETPATGRTLDGGRALARDQPAGLHEERGVGRCCLDVAGALKLVGPDAGDAGVDRIGEDPHRIVAERAHRHSGKGAARISYVEGHRRRIDSRAGDLGEAGRDFHQRVDLVDVHVSPAPATGAMLDDAAPAFAVSPAPALATALSELPARATRPGSVSVAKAQVRAIPLVARLANAAKALNCERAKPATTERALICAAADALSAPRPTDLPVVAIPVE